jgi:hypothetical protein
MKPPDFLQNGDKYLFMHPISEPEVSQLLQYTYLSEIEQFKKPVLPAAHRKLHLSFPSPGLPPCRSHDDQKGIYPCTDATVLMTCVKTTLPGSDVAGYYLRM